MASLASTHLDVQGSLSQTRQSKLPPRYQVSPATRPMEGCWSKLSPGLLTRQTPRAPYSRGPRAHAPRNAPHTRWSQLEAERGLCPRQRPRSWRPWPRPSRRAAPCLGLCRALSTWKPPGEAERTPGLGEQSVHLDTSLVPSQGRSGQTGHLESLMAMEFISHKPTRVCRPVVLLYCHRPSLILEHSHGPRETRSPLAAIPIPRPSRACSHSAPDSAPRVPNGSQSHFLPRGVGRAAEHRRARETPVMSVLDSGA